jgi:hypothetical protein
MTRKFLYPLRDWSLGQNDKDSPNLIPDNALVEAKNAILGRGFVAKRYGYIAYAWTPTGQRATVWSEFGFKKWSEV